MNKRYSFLGAVLVVFAALLCSCSNSSNTSSYWYGTPTGFPNGNPTGGTQDGNSAAAPTTSTTLNVDYGENATLAAVAWTQTVYIDLTNSKYSTDNSAWNVISTDSANPSAVVTNVTIYNDSGYIKINTSGTTDPLQFVLSGTLSSGEMFFANKKDSVIGIYMNGVSIASGNYPCVEFDKKGTVYLVLSGANALTDGRKYGKAYSAEHSTVAGYIENASESKGTFHVKGSLNISASTGASEATLTVTENYKHGIYASDKINFYGGVVTVNSTGRNGFQCKNAFNMFGGTAIVYGSGAHTNNESRGIVVEGDDTGDTDGLGYFNMTGGAVNIKTVSKGITAKWDSDDASASPTCTVNPVVTISGGKINIVTYGTPKEEASTASSFTDADGETVSEKIKCSPEGIEGKAGVTITGGTLNITTTDDCINASSGAIEISDGTIYAYSSANDCIDSNGTLTISGGTIVALTATTPECAFDCDQNTFAITGGTLIGIGTSNYSAPTASACGQSVIVVSGNYLGSVGTTFALKDSSGAAAFAFEIPSAIYNSMSSNLIAVFSSSSIAAGTSYSLCSGVTASGGTKFNGLYTTLPTVSGGSATISGVSTSTGSLVYTKSDATSGGGQPGGTPPN
ncbi:MAG: carbohydrate-binding domain-containing protein [Treponema sp.]|nr:carbohydrate-binding domain-containing protein [Treponema sp.]